MFYHRLPSQRTLSFLLYSFIFLHVALWTLAPILFRHNLPLDAIEGTIWGHQLQLGYDKNPFMNGWLTALAVFLGGYSGWMIYFFSQISVGLCFWALWRLGTQFMPALYVISAIFMLEGIQYYNLHAIDFNDNTLELSLWTLTTLVFYFTLTRQRWRDFILLGIFAAACMMTKYFALLLFYSMLVVLIITPQGRAVLRTGKFYVALIVFLLLCLPHAAWLFKHNFITIHYACHRVASSPAWSNHLFFPVKFTVQQLEALLPGLILLSALYIGKRPALAPQALQLSRFNFKFLAVMALGPFVLTVLISIVTGITLRAGWGQPLFSLLGFLIIAQWAPAITPTKWWRFCIFAFCVLFLTVLGYAVALCRAASPSSAFFPGKELALQITEEWHQRFHRPLKYIAGPRFIAGSIAFYSPDHPAVFMEWNKEANPWIDEEDLKKSGAVFVWDQTIRPPMDLAVLKRRYVRLHDASSVDSIFAIVYLSPGSR